MVPVGDGTRCAVADAVAVVVGVARVVAAGVVVIEGETMVAVALGVEATVAVVVEGATAVGTTEGVWEGIQAITRKSRQKPRSKLTDFIAFFIVDHSDEGDSIESKPLSQLSVHYS
jgi:hypothetical protein